MAKRVFRCPKCGEEAVAVVAAMIYVNILLLDEGPQFEGAPVPKFSARDAIWNTDDNCRCLSCGWTGQVYQARKIAEAS